MGNTSWEPEERWWGLCGFGLNQLLESFAEYTRSIEMEFAKVVKGERTLIRKITRAAGNNHKVEDR